MSSGFKPVFLPPELAPTEAYSATFGRAYNVCPRSAFFYAKYRRSPAAATANLLRGSALHRILELCTRVAIEQGETRVPPDVAKAIAAEVLADPDYFCPIEEHDYIRESVYRWAAETEIDPETEVATEQLFELDVDGMRIRAKIDRAVLLEEGRAVAVDDYKSSRNLPSYEDIGRKRRDGTIAAKDYQLVVYGLAIVFGVPIRESVDLVTGERVEVREPFGLAEQAQRVDLSYVFPGIEEKSTETMARRSVSLTKVELYEYLESLRAQVAQVRSSVQTGDWPAVYGESHCVECPAQAECPIPAERRRFAGTINTVEQAREASEQLAAEKLVHTARDKELVTFVKSLPAGSQRILWGRNHVLEVGYQESEEIIDREAMWEAVRQATELGVPFERERFVRVKKSTPIRRRKLTEAELEELAENERTGSDG